MTPKTKDRVKLAGCGCLTFAVGMFVIGLIGSKGRKSPVPPADSVALVASAPPPTRPPAAPASVVAAAKPADAPKPAEEPKPTGPEQPEKEWYLGGTLHNAGALEWQKATPEDKLATCADLVVSMKDSGRLKRSMAARIKSVDDVRLPAAQLVVAIDKATAAETDPVKNRQLFVNQKVASMAALTAALMGWLE